MNQSSSNSTLGLKVALVCLVCLGLGAGLRGPQRANGSFPSGLLRANPLSAHFAIADWDGDEKPDVASVEGENGRTSPSQYSIRVQLSGRPESALGVSAPSGGLQLTARDVNGDDNVDLVVRSDSDARFIQVFLNDGHGNFSVAEPGPYLALASEETVFFQGPPQSCSERLSLAQTRSTFDGEDIVSCANPVVLATDCATFPKIEVVLSSSHQARRGRAPPLPASEA